MDKSSVTVAVSSGGGVGFWIPGALGRRSLGLASWARAGVRTVPIKKQTMARNDGIGEDNMNSSGHEKLI